MTVSLPSPDAPFTTLAELIRSHARQQPAHAALRDDQQMLSYAQLDALMDRVAAALQRDGVQPGQAIAICALNSVRYAVLFLGALRAGVVVAPLAPSSTADSLASMLRDAQERHLFLDKAAQDLVPADGALQCISLDGAAPGRAFDDWLAPEGAQPAPVSVEPAAPFNIIYSSGTTGTPKGIVQSHGMRWAHINRGSVYGYGPEGTTLLATPLYSNTTLVVFFPTLGSGGCVVVMPKFDAARYLQLAQQHRVTHTMLVPVQYQRIMALPQFGEHDLSSFRAKFCTSAPFRAELKADVVARWPGSLTEFYGMTEGGVRCELHCHDFPDKLHTVGRPGPGADIRFIDEQGRELSPGEQGEIVGRSAGMMSGYHRLPDKTQEAEWFDAQGLRFIRSGDVGRLDEDGFIVLGDRKKDMIITGGFNVYPSDIESVLLQHPQVAECAVIGVPSDAWGETPVAYAVAHPDATPSAAELREWLNARVGKTQRVAELRLAASLPRSEIGKVLKRALREQYQAGALSSS